MANIFFWVVIVVLIVVGILIKLGVLKKLGGRLSRAPGAGESFPYEANKYFFTRAENSFFRILYQAVGDRYVIFAKVRLCDVLAVSRGVERRQAHLNRIQSKHLDFVLCEPRNFGIRAAIELDDASHRRTHRVSRDLFVDSAFKAAGLPLLHIPAKRGYVAQELAQRVLSATGDVSPASLP